MNGMRTSARQDERLSRFQNMIFAVEYDQGGAFQYLQEGVSWCCVRIKSRSLSEAEEQYSDGVVFSQYLAVHVARLAGDLTRQGEDCGVGDIVQLVVYEDGFMESSGRGAGVALLLEKAVRNK